MISEGWIWNRPGAEPALRAVDLDADARARRTTRQRKNEPTRISGVSPAHERDAARPRGRFSSTSPTAPKSSGALEVVGASPESPSSEVVELALKTMTTPKASRHSVAVSSSEYSIGCGGLRAACFADFLSRSSAQLLDREPGSARRAPRSRGRRRSSRTPGRAGRPRRPSRRPRPRRDGLGEPVAAAVLHAGRPGGLEVALERARRPRRSDSRPTQRSATGATSPAKPPPLSEPPRIARTPPSNERSAATAAATLVALESLT